MSDELAPIRMNNTVVSEGGNAKPFPEGYKVLARILQTKKEGPAYIEKRPYAKEGDNNSITALAIRFEFIEGQAGQGRNEFVDVPWARNLNTTSNGKYPEGTPAYFYFQLFRSLGYNVDVEKTQENPEGLFAYPGDHALLGQIVELVLGIEDEVLNPQTKEVVYPERNRVAFINKANGFPDNKVVLAAAEKRAQAQPGVAKATAAAAPGWKPESAPAVTATPPAQGWTPPPAQGAWSPAPADAQFAAAQTSQGF